jgi:hypothetical protein
MFVLNIVFATAHKSDSHCLRSHTIPLHSNAFDGCTSLTAANLPNVASVGEYVAHLHDSILCYAPLANGCLCDITSTTQNTCARRRALTTRVIACTARHFSARCALLLHCDVDDFFSCLRLLTKVTLTVCARTPFRFTVGRFMVAPA